MSLLSKGLSFVPTVSPDPFDLLVDVYKFQHKLKLKEHYKDSAETTIFEFGAKSTFEPPNTPAPIKTFGKIMCRDINGLKARPVQRYNLNSVERHAIKTLKEDTDLVIGPADKGGAIVLLDYGHYQNEILGQLSDTATYRLLPSDPTSKFKKALDEFLLLARNGGMIDENTYGFLVTQFARVPIIYTLPKVHKSLSSPPGRPIISAVGSLYQPISTYVDHFLQPLVKAMFS